MAHAHPKYRTSVKEAEMLTLWVPPCSLVPAFSTVVNIPLELTVDSAPAPPHFMLTGSRSRKMEMGFPLRASFPLLSLDCALNLPWAELVGHVDLHCCVSGVQRSLHKKWPSDKRGNREPELLHPKRSFQESLKETSWFSTDLLPQLTMGLCPDKPVIR